MRYGISNMLSVKKAISKQNKEYYLLTVKENKLNGSTSFASEKICKALYDVLVLYGVIDFTDYKKKEDK